MPGYQATQQTFTAHFTDALDAIDRTESCPCYHRWLELAKNIRSESTAIGCSSTAVKDTRQHRSQRRTGRAAASRHTPDLIFLMEDFIVVKKILFPGVWKFGVGCRLLGQEHVLYQLSSIRRGEPAPLIFELPDSVTPNILGQNVRTSVAQPRETFFSSPEKCARKYVLGVRPGSLASQSIPAVRCGKWQRM